MTAKELRSYNDLKKLIERNKTRLAEISARLDPGSMDFSGMPRSGSTRNTTADNLALYVDLKNMIEKQQTEYLRKQIVIERFIGTVNDMYIRRIISYHFIDRLTWRQTAHKIGGGNTADSVRKACNRYLDQKSQTAS